jgi:hypothetical protein
LLHWLLEYGLVTIRGLKAEYIPVASFFTDTVPALVPPFLERDSAMALNLVGSGGSLLCLEDLPFKVEIET